MDEPRHGLEGSFGYHQVGATERQRRIRAVFNAVAPRYDLMNDLMSFGIHRLWKRRFVRDLPLTGQVVDLAGGTGDVARLMCARGASQVLVVDPSVAMMQAGRGLGAGSMVWLAGEGEQLPLADASVDTLTISFGLRNTTHLERALQEIHRVLVPGGTFACLEFSRAAPWLRPFYDLYSFHVIPRLGASVARAPEAYQYLVESIRRFPDQRAFADLLRQAGFDRVGWRNLSFGIACIHTARRPLDTAS